MKNQGDEAQEGRERTLPPPPHFEYAQTLLKWVYVIQQERFVHLDDFSVRCDVNQFNELYAPSRLPRGQKPSNYIRNTNRKTNVVYRIDCLPLSKETICRDELGLPLLNTFRQPPKIPLDSEMTASYKPIIELIQFLAGGNKDSVEHILRWLAHVYCRPDKRMHHGLMIAGPQGTGKSTIGEIMVQLCGEGAKVIGPKQLRARFNTWMLGTRLVVVEEIREGGDYGLYNKIKTNFTDQKIVVEPKGQDEFYVENPINYLMFSNSSVPISIEADDRRIYFVWSRTEKKLPRYYRDFRKAVFEDGGIWAFGRYLRDVVLPNVPEDFATLPPPVSKDHAELAVAGANPIEAYLKEKLEEGGRIYAPKIFFDARRMRSEFETEEHLKSALRNSTEYNDILRRHGYQTQRKEIGGRKYTFGWFDRNGWGDELRKIFSIGNHRERKQLLKGHYYVDDFVPCTLFD